MKTSLFECFLSQSWMEQKANIQHPYNMWTMCSQFCPNRKNLNLEPIWDKNDASISGTASLKLLCCTVALFYSSRPIGKSFSLRTQTFASLQTGGWISPTGRAMFGQEFSEPHNPPVSIE